MIIQHSYDIFDTCLSRLCGDSKDVFVLMAQRIFGESCTDTLVNDYRYMRVNAEIEATISHKAYTTLTDIYEQLDFTTYTGLSKEQLIALELSIEELNLRPIKSTLDEIVKIHNDGGRIIYISDMYLPSEFLKGILEKFGFWKERDSIYVSCEIGCTKNSGALFDYVKERENLNIKKWVHHGDNLISDIKVPKKKGIETKQIVGHYTKIQNVIRNLGQSATSNISHLFSGLLRSVYLENGQNAMNLFAIDLIAPVYVPFVYNVLKDAQKRKIKRLYFLSRDGYIFYKIAEVFKALFPDVDINYLYVSRKSLYLPSIFEINKDTLNSLIINTTHSNFNEHVDNLQVEFDEHFFKELSKGNDPIDVILHNKKYIKLIENRIAEQKKLVIQYFEQEGLASYNQDTAIVDLRGTRRCQKCISDILKSFGYKEVYGYYLEAVHNRIYPEAKDEYCAYFFGDNIKDKSLFSGLDSVKDVLEHYFSITPFSRTSGYSVSNNKIIPLFDDDNLDRCECRKIMEVNIQLSRCIAEKIIFLKIEDYTNEMLNLGLAGLASFMRNPGTEYIKAIVSVKASQTSHHSKDIVKKIRPSSVLNHEIMWYEGSIKYTFGSVGLSLFQLCLPVLKKIYKWIK